VVQMDTDLAPIHLCESVFICGSPRRYEVLAIDIQPPSGPID